MPGGDPAGAALRVVGDEAWDGVKTLIVPPGQVPGLDARLTEFSQNGGQVIALQQMRTAAPVVHCGPGMSRFALAGNTGR